MGDEDIRDEEVFLLRYVIWLPQGDERTLSIRMRHDTLDLVLPDVLDPPTWANLAFNRCPNCPLDLIREAHCPVAVALVGLADSFKEFASFAEVDVRVESPERKYAGHCSLQDVAGAIVGIYLTTSGCPILDRMRPMIRTHLPFPSEEETFYRLASMYLYAQSARARKGEAADWTFKGLIRYFGEIETVNQSLCKRLNAARTADGDVLINAVNVLNSSLSLVRLSLEEGDAAYWDDLFLRHWGGESD